MARRIRHGFTLVELLVVIGIISVLLAIIATLGMQIWSKGPSDKLTQTRLSACSALLSHYDPSGSLLGLEGTAPAVYQTPANAPPPSITSNPGDVTFGSYARYSINQPAVGSNPAISSSWAVLNTGLVFQQFSRDPAVKNDISELPPECFLQANVGTGGPWIFSPTLPIVPQPNGFIGNNKALPVILDGWKNPIIYVPSGGLHSVYLGGVIPYDISASTGWVAKTWTKGTPGSPGGVTDGSVPPGGGQWAKRRVLVTSADGRPFFASAGPDGNFSSGDDNLYSVPVVYTDE